MTPQRKTIALFAVVAYLSAVPLSATLWGVQKGAWLLLAALAPCAIAVGWVKILFLQPHLQTIPGFFRGGSVGLLSYLSFALLAAAYMSFASIAVSGLPELLWYFLIVGTVMFGLPMMLVGAFTGLLAERLFLRAGAPAAEG